MIDYEHELEQTPQEKEILVDTFNNALRVKNILPPSQVLDLLFTPLIPTQKETSKYRKLLQKYPHCFPLSIDYNRETDEITLFYSHDPPPYHKTKHRKKN